MVQGTIWLEQTGKFQYGSRDMAALRGKWVNESPVYVFRDRSLAVPERGSPAALTLEGNNLLLGFLLGVAASYVADALYFRKRRKK